MPNEIEIAVPNNSVSIFNSEDADGHTPGADVWLENERAMWWAEFDGVGEDAVRHSVERHSYPPTGMEIARQWLGRREFLQLRGDVQSIRALAEQAQEAAYESLRIASEAFAEVSRADANRLVIAEIAATDKKRARTMLLVGTVTTLFGLSAIVMALAFSRQGTANAKQASARLFPAKQAVSRPQLPAVPSEENRLVSEIPNAKEGPPNAPHISSRDVKSEGRSVAERRQPPQSRYKASRGGNRPTRP